MVYNFNKTLKKVFWITAEVIVAGAIVLATDSIYYVGLVPIFEGLRNWIKHR